jgi:hypothetical protein
MNRDDITRMAREAGFVGFDGDNGSLRRFAALVAAAEREAILQMSDDSWFETQAQYDNAIRARGEHD